MLWQVPAKVLVTHSNEKQTCDESCQRISPSLQFFFNNTRRSIEATFFSTMAWRSSGDTNDELVRNLKREFTHTLFVSHPRLESKVSRTHAKVDSIRRASIDRMTYASDA